MILKTALFAALLAIASGAQAYCPYDNWMCRMGNAVEQNTATMEQQNQERIRQIEQYRHQQRMEQLQYEQNQILRQQQRPTQTYNPYRDPRVYR